MGGFIAGLTNALGDPTLANRAEEQWRNRQALTQQIGLGDIQQIRQAIAGIQANPYLSEKEKSGRIQAAQSQQLQTMIPLVGRQAVQRILSAHPDLAPFKAQTGTVPAEAGTSISAGGNDLQQLAAMAPQVSPQEMQRLGVSPQQAERPEGTDFSQIPNVQPAPVQEPAKGPTQVSLTPPTTADVLASGAPTNMFIPVTRPDGTTFMVPAKMAMPYLTQDLRNAGAMERTTKSLESHESEGKEDRDTKKYIAEMQQGAPVTVPPELAQAVGMPEFGGQQVGKATMNNIAKLAGTLGFQYKDIGAHRWLVNKMGDKLVDMGPSPASVQPAIAAQYKPFDTSDSQGQPTTISAAEAIRSGAPALRTWNTVFGPTSQTKSQAQAAGAVSEHIPAFKQAVENLQAKGELGPVMGRINSLVTEGYGGSDPDIAEFVTTVGLLKSGALRAHFGSRGGLGYLDRFDQYLNTKQTGPALLGSIDAIQRFMQGYAQAGTPKPPHTNIAPKGPSTQQPPSQQGPPLRSGYIRIRASDKTEHDIPKQNLEKAKQIDPNLTVIAQ